MVVYKFGFVSAELIVNISIHTTVKENKYE